MIMILNAIKNIELTFLNFSGDNYFLILKIQIIT